MKRDLKNGGICYEQQNSNKDFRQQKELQSEAFETRRMMMRKITSEHESLKLTRRKNSNR